MRPGILDQAAHCAAAVVPEAGASAALPWKPSTQPGRPRYALPAPGGKMSDEKTDRSSEHSTATVSDVQRRAVNAIRALTVDATQEAGDGHPGMPMGAAPMGYLLFTEAMRHDPGDPEWPNRDRYVQ